VWFLGKDRAEGEQFGGRYARYYELFASVEPAGNAVRDGYVEVAEDASAAPSTRPF
jgi:hypothetical protein